MLTGLVVAIALFGLILFIATRPAAFSVTRAAHIDAPPAIVFPYLNSPRAFQDRSPWAKMDPGARIAYSGPDEGVDAAFAWEGRRTGAGRMTITESRPDRFVGSRLEFLKPFRSVSVTMWALEPEAEGTRIVWTMSGRNNFAAKAMSLVMSCEKMLGTQFEAGLDTLKRIAENRPSA